MREYIEWFNQVLTVAILLYFHQESEYKQLKDVYPPRNGWMEAVTGQMDTNFEERIVIMLDAPYLSANTGHLLCAEQEL